MPDLFKETIPSILKTKNDVYENDNEAKDYVPFVVNRALSYHVDCLHFVADLNRYANQIPKKQQYQFLFNGITSRFRKFAAWEKPIKEEDVDLIVEYYKVSNVKAREYLSILTEDEKKSIREYLSSKGGVVSNKKRESSKNE